MIKIDFNEIKQREIVWNFHYKSGSYFYETTENNISYKATLYRYGAEYNLKIVSYNNISKKQPLIHVHYGLKLMQKIEEATKLMNKHMDSKLVFI